MGGGTDGDGPGRTDVVGMVSGRRATPSELGGLRAAAFLGVMAGGEPGSYSAA